jgi:hypothetical protein
MAPLADQMSIKFRVYRKPLTPQDWDMITSRFIKLLASDIEIDWMISSLGPLFAFEPPKGLGGYHHHGR